MKYSIEEARRLRAIIENQMQTADEEIAVQAVSLYPIWKHGMDYVAGYRVQHKGVLYLVLADHTSQETWPPEITASLYAQVLIPDPDVIPAWMQPESTNGYSKGDKVSHNGVTYESLIDNKVWVPGTAGTEALWRVAE